jgi:hypothetical protein
LRHVETEKYDIVFVRTSSCEESTDAIKSVDFLRAHDAVKASRVIGAIKIAPDKLASVCRAERAGEGALDGAEPRGAPARALLLRVMAL